MNIGYEGRSGQGAVRKRNEDAYLMRVCKKAALFLVADGMGGKKHGQEASRRIESGYSHWWEDRFLPLQEETTFSQALDSLEAELLRVNAEIVAEFGRQSAGSTLVLLFLYHGKFAYLSAGDSRIYRSGLFSFRQITRDDTVENLQNRPAGENGEKLVGAVGLREHLDYTEGTGDLRKFDSFLLCSDGIYRYVEPKVLRRLVLLGGKVMKPERLIRKIEAAVQKNGAGDNYSMIYVKLRK